MSRIDQINEMLKIELANLIEREIPLEDGLVTVVYADCAPDFSTARIGISVLPDKYFGTVLKTLRKHSTSFSRALNKKIKIRKIPKLFWEPDFTEKEAAVIDDILRQIKEVKTD